MDPAQALDAWCLDDQKTESPVDWSSDSGPSSSSSSSSSSGPPSPSGRSQAAASEASSHRSEAAAFEATSHAVSDNGAASARGSNEESGKSSDKGLRVENGTPFPCPPRASFLDVLHFKVYETVSYPRAVEVGHGLSHASKPMPRGGLPAAWYHAGCTPHTNSQIWRLLSPTLRPTLQPRRARVTTGAGALRPWLGGDVVPCSEQHSWVA